MDLRKVLAGSGKAFGKVWEGFWEGDAFTGDFETVSLASFQSVSRNSKDSLHESLHFESFWVQFLVDFKGFGGDPERILVLFFGFGSSMGVISG